MKKAILFVLASVLAMGAAFAAPAPVTPFGSIDYVEGSAMIVRSGKTLGEANIGDDILPDDMIKTSADGLVVIALDRSTGMRGTLTIKAQSVVYVRMTADPAGAKSTIELMAGQLASKLTKVSGNPTVQVRTDTTVMGVRGTDFSVSSSVTGSTMVYCSTGAVECYDGESTVSVAAGRAVEKRPAERMAFIPVAVSTPGAFENRWWSDEIEVFKGNPARFLIDYEKRYDDLYARFMEAFEPLQKSEILAKWMREDDAGYVPPSNDMTVLKEKKDMIGSIQQLRKILFIFERIYYRIVQLDAIVSGMAIDGAQLRKGYTVGDFLRRVKAEAALLERRVALFRYAEKLYELRNVGGAGMPGMGGGTDDFFGSDDGFDF